MEWTPVPVAEFLLLHLSALARPAALLGALAVVMLTGGIAGLIAWLFGRDPISRPFGPVAVAAFLAMIFLVLIPGGDMRPPLLLVLTISALVSTLVPLHTYDGGRRDFLIRSGTILGGAALLLGLFSVRPLLGALSARRLFSFRPPRGMRLAGMPPLVTPSNSFYLMDKVLQYPQIGPPAWNLTIDGEVARALTLDYGSLLARHAVHRYVTLECVDNPVGGPLMSNGLWTGVPIEDLLREAGATGHTVVFHSSDDYRESAPRSALAEAGALVAYGLNGDVLPRSHGYPARLVLPGVYGFKSVKWLTHIEVTSSPDSGNWQAHGWDVEARVHTTARIDVARRGGASLILAGVAFAGTRGIRAVQVRVNGGPWRPATLGRALSHESWVQWAVRIRGRGPARVEVRAVDGSGAVQTGRVHGAYPSGATGWHSVSV
jgi:DMSO/TMAO reductase YedYZ molybdopterin-dependent catalytic subunit